VMLARKVSRLPVVDRADPTRLIGLLEWKGLARAWQRATEDEHIRESTTRLGARLRLARRVRRRPGRRHAILRNGETETAGNIGSCGSLHVSENSTPNEP